MNAKFITIFILMLFCSFSNQLKSQSSSGIMDCGLTYFYDAGGNRIIRMIVPCVPPSDKKGDTSNITAGISPIAPDSSTLAAFQIVMISPNPTSGPISITCNQNLTNAQVTVSDLNGQTVSQTTANGMTFSLDVSKLAPGAYNVVVTSNGSPTGRTIIKTK